MYTKNKMLWLACRRLTFKERRHPPDSHRTEAGELSVGDLHEEQGDATQEQEDGVRDEEGTCGGIEGECHIYFFVDCGENSIFYLFFFIFFGWQGGTILYSHNSKQRHGVANCAMCVASFLDRESKFVYIFYMNNFHSVVSLIAVASMSHTYLVALLFVLALYGTAALC